MMFFSQAPITKGASAASAVTAASTSFNAASISTSPLRAFFRASVAAKSDKMVAALATGSLSVADIQDFAQKAAAFAQAIKSLK